MTVLGFLKWGVIIGITKNWCAAVRLRQKVAGNPVDVLLALATMMLGVGGAKANSEGLNS